jgi:hypothetical protein
MSLVFCERDSARAAAAVHHGEGLDVHLADSSSSSSSDVPRSASAAASLPHARTQRKSSAAGVPPPTMGEDDDCFDTPEGHSFEDYHRVHFLAGVDHPGRLVESASLSSVDPPPILYKLSLPDFVSLSY